MKKNKQQITALERVVAVIMCRDNVLVQKGEKGKVMADLYEFPYVKKEEEDVPIDELFEKKIGLKLSYIQKLPPQQHSFTRYRVKLFPHLLKVEALDSRFIWKSFSELKNLPFSSGHRRILNTLEY